MAQLKPWIVPLFLLSLHVLMMADAARRTSPSWDEIIYPAAGVAQWKTHQVVMNPEHGALAKLIHALPLLALHTPLPTHEESWARRDAQRFGYDFTYRNTVAPQRIIFWGRFASLVCSLAIGFLLWRWSTTLWGQLGGFLSLACYITTPILLSRASTALLEAPMYLFLLLALRVHALAASKNLLPLFAAAGALASLALQCKFPALPLLPAFFVLNVVGPGRSHSLSGFIQRVGALAGGFVLAWLVVAAPWVGAWGSLQTTVKNLFQFDSILAYTWHGRLYENAPALLSWGAFLIKAPLGGLILGLAGAHVWHRQASHRIVYWHAGVLALACMLSIFFFSRAVTTVQFSPVYLSLALLAGALAPALKNSLWKNAAVATLVLWNAGEVLCVHPNYLAYFNGSVGGPAQGYRWLGDSDQDWGQSLPRLHEFIQRHPGSHLILAYSGAGDPVAHGLTFQDLFSPALMSRYNRSAPIGSGNGSVFVALATKVVQSEPALAQWIISQRKPIAQVDPCFLVYDITSDADAYRWLATIYRETGRPTLASWAMERSHGPRPRP